jgi:hypothetical protein
MDFQSIPEDKFTNTSSILGELVEEKTVEAA